MAAQQVAQRLLERGRHLSTLNDALRTVTGGKGGVLVLLGAEAGGGKTTLVRQFCDSLGSARVLWGACDPLFTPRPLGPFVDIAQDVGGELAALLDAGAKPYQVAMAITREARVHKRTIIVLEDLHWADEATLDVLSLLGRRIEALPALVIATYRDDELDRTHPLRMLLGEMRSTHAVRRLSAEPLSPEAVRALAEPYGLDALVLYNATAGNPFFVTEVIGAHGPSTVIPATVIPATVIPATVIPGAAVPRAVIPTVIPTVIPMTANPDTMIPSNVRDAVMARAARLSRAAATIAEAISIALPQAETWLLNALAPETLGSDGALEECLHSGMLKVVPAGVAFRHELARMAIEETLPSYRRVALHRSALEALRAAPVGADLARLAHHADAAGDAAAVLRFAPAAAEHAASIGAHREAAAQYARALRFGSDLPADTRAGLLECLSYECYLTDQLDESIDALNRAIEYRRAASDRRGEASALSALSRRLYCGGRVDRAEQVAGEALRLLDGMPPGPELALAYSNLGQISMNDERLDATLDWVARALAIAEKLDDTAVIVHSLNNLGTIQLLAGVPEGVANMERSLALAEQAQLEEHVGRAFINIGWAMTRTRTYELAPWLDRGVKRCEELGLELWKLYVLAYRARFQLDSGRWSAAAADASAVLRSSASAPLLRIQALTVLGLVRARRGDPEQWPPLDEAFALTQGQVELQYRAPVAAARAEAAWLDGRGAVFDEDTRAVITIAAQRNAPWVVGELTWLQHLVGSPRTGTATIEPYSTQLAGDGPGAAAHWTKLGCPYDAALALLDSDDEGSLRTAYAELQRLGARPAAAHVARRLREQGVRGLPRGPRSVTIDNPASLTPREAEVFALVQEGASNADIAARLFLSEKTVQHHVSAILRKLGVTSRVQAVSKAMRLGLTTPA